MCQKWCVFWQEGVARSMLPVCEGYALRLNGLLWPELGTTFFGNMQYLGVKWCVKCAIWGLKRRKMHFFCTFLLFYLVNSKKSSTFAAVFERKPPFLRLGSPKIPDFWGELRHESPQRSWSSADASFFCDLVADSEASLAQSVRASDC